MQCSLKFEENACWSLLFEKALHVWNMQCMTRCAFQNVCLLLESRLRFPDAIFRRELKLAHQALVRCNGEKLSLDLTVSRS